MELVATAFTLAAEFLKTRKELGESATADDFQLWMQNTAFPQLVDLSSKILGATVALKAGERERFDVVLGHLLAIREGLGLSSDYDRWAILPKTEKTILKLVAESALSDVPSVLEGDDISGASDINLKAARYLDELCLVELHENTGGWAVDGTPDGVHIYLSGTQPETYPRQRARIARALPERSQVARVSGIAKRADVSCGLVSNVVAVWGKQGLLTLESGTWPPGQWSVLNVRETLHRLYRSSAAD